MKNEQVIINQVLHGYRQGHELLASSLELSSADKRKMLYLSDSSGSEFSETFDGYLEGYPLSSESYVLSRTWRATEMRRPGCVWTHSLIFSSESLAKLENLFSIFSFFKRPQSTEDFSQYKSKLTIHIEKFSELHKHSNFADLAYSYVFFPDKQIIIPAIDREQVEFDLANFWTLLSAEQKFSLSFCTGYFSLNQPSKDSFQIAYIPKTGKRFSWDKNTAVYLDRDKSLSQDKHSLAEEEYKEIFLFSLKETGLSKQTIENTDHLFQLITKNSPSEFIKRIPISIDETAIAAKLFGPKALRFKALKDLPEIELLKTIVTNKSIRHMDEIDVFKRIEALTPNDALDVFRETLFFSNDGDNRKFSVHLYELLPAVQNEKIVQAPKWFLIHLITNNIPFNDYTLWSLSNEEILSVLSHSLDQNKAETLKFLENKADIVHDKQFDFWLLLNVELEDFDYVAEKFKINIIDLPNSYLKRLVLKFPFKILPLVQFNKISEEVAFDLFANSIKSNNSQLFFEKLDAVDLLEKLNWREELWLNILFSVVSRDSMSANRVFVRAYPFIMRRLIHISSKEKRFNWTDILPFGRYFKSSTPLDGLRFSLLNLVLLKRISISEFISCLTTSEEIYELQSVLSTIDDHQLRKFKSLLSSYNGTDADMDKVHFLLSMVDNI